MKQDNDHTYTLVLITRNRPGLLVRCAQVFGRRGHNIEALHVLPKPRDRDLSIMTITAYGQPAMMEQIVSQLTKLIDVVKVTKKEEQ